MGTYIAHGQVRETGAILQERILFCKTRNFALRIARGWAEENGLKLMLLEEARTIWVRNGVEPK